MAHVDRIGSAVVESASATGTITLGAGKAAAVGETVMVAVTVESGAGTIPSVSSVTDSRGNTYAVDKTAGAGTPTPNTTVALILARGAVTTALTAGDTITVTLGETRTRWAMIAETFDDVSDTSPLDKTAANNNPGSSGSLSSGTTATTAEANELLIGVFGFGAGRDVDIPAGWSGGAVVETAAGSTNRSVQLIWRYVTATGAQQATLTIDPASTYAGLIATYKLASESHEGTATISGSLAMSAAGTPAIGGTGGLAGELAMTATGSASITGAGSITGLLTMTARGTADTSIGLPPRPRTRWQLILGPASGGHELALTMAQGRRYTARLTDNSDLSFDIDGRHPQAAAIAELRTDVHLLFSGDDGQTQILDRCRVGSTRDTIEDASHRVEVTCLDYRAVLVRRILHSGDTLTYSAVDQTDIAWGLIDTTQSHAAGDLGIRKGIIDDYTGVARDRTYEAGDSVGQRIQELSEVIDGFDWDVLPEGPVGLRFDAWYPRRGSDRGVVLVQGGLASAITREVNPSDYANALRYTGAQGDDDNPGPTPVEREAGYLGYPGAFPEGRWDAVFGDDSLTTQAALEDRAEWQLAQSQVVTPVYTVRLKRGAWRGPDHIWLGDTVRLVVPSGRLDVETSQRVYEIAIDMDGDGGESVELTLGGPKPDFRRWPSQIERRLKGLERR